MMKKIFALVLLLVLGKLSYSQYPLQQNLGSDSTIVISKGALQSRLINVTFVDTSAANNQRIRQYPGAQIATTSGGINLWVRNTTATAWLPINTGSGNNIYTIDGTLTGNRTLTGNNYSLTFTGLSQFLLSVGNQTFTVRSDSASLTRKLSYASNRGSTFTLYSLVDKNYVDSAIASSPAGTVTQINTNNNTGITGGPITSTGTLAIDTLLISTRAWRQKGVDSLQANINLKLNIVDTTGMLANYVNSVGYGLGKTSQTVYVDSASLSNYYLRRKDSLTTTNPLGYVTKKVLADTAAAIRSSDLGGTVTSVATNNGTGITGGTITTSGTLAIDTTVISTRAWRQKGVDSLQANINLKLNISDTASMLSPYLRSNTAAATYVPQTRTITINGNTQDLTANRTYNVGTVTSVGLTMPAAFNVANSPVTGSGTLAVTGAGLASQYIRGDGTLANFPGGGGGGGASVSYYLNGSVNQGTFGGNTYYQMNKTPILGAGTNFTTNTNGYIAQFITNAGDPALLNIPAGNWNFELFFSASSGGGTPSYYVELYKYDGTTFTLIASGSSNPDVIVNSAVDAYFSALPVPQTTLTLTDRLAVRIYVTPAGRTITLHTEDNNLCQVVTTFTTGITAINSLTAQVQYLTTGTSGTDFNISSLTDTHTFNLPVASGTNTGKLSNTDWTTFNNKVGGSLVNGYITKATGTNTIDTSQLFQSSGLIGIGTTSPTQKLQVSGNAYVNGQLFAGDTALSVYQVEGILNIPYVLGRKAVNNTLSTEARPTGVMGHVVGRGSIANRLQAANFYTTTDSASTANSTGSLRSVNAWTAHNGSGSLTTAWGSYNIVQNKTTGTITNAYGSVSGVENRGATSTINKLHGTTTEIWNNYGGTIDTAFGQVISIYNNNAASNIGAVYGLSIGKGLISASGGTHYWRNSGTIGTSYGLYLDSSIDVGTTKYALFSNSNSDSYLRGNLGLGTTTPGGRLAIVDTGGFALKINYNSASTDANNNAALYAENNGLSSYVAILNEKTTNNTGGQYPILIESSLTSGTAQSGMATGIHFGVPDDAGNRKVTQLALRTTDPAAATYTNRAELRLWNNGSLSTPYYLLGNGNMGLGTATPDSNLTVVNGALFQRGVRMSGLPTGPGTKALRINASGTISIADTLIDAGGTVTSVATNNGTGITGGTITTTGTLAIDTLLISTRAWRQKGIDSVAALINSNVSGTTNYVSKFTGTSTIGNSSIFDNGSNVGIGTASPASTPGYRTLSLNGTSGSILDFKTNGTSRYQIYGDATRLAIENLTGPGGIYLNQSNGYVGIATTGPDSLLTVNGSTHLKNAVRMSGLPTGTGTKSLRVDANGTVSIADTLANGISGSGTANYIPKFTSSSAIGNSVIYESSSNIGIGTITPVHPLDVINAGGTGISTRNAETNYSILRIGTDVSNGYAFIQSGNAGTGTILPLAFRFGSNERMRLDASGRVSIGGTTVTDGHLLNIQGSSAANNIGIILNKTNATAQIWGITNVGALTFYDYTNSAERMRLDASGNLGLGVTPSAWRNIFNAFQVGYTGTLYSIATGTAVEQVNLASNYYQNSAGSELRIQAGFATRYQQASGQHIWSTAGTSTANSGISFTQAMTLDASGRLGIGTTSPSQRLSVFGGNLLVNNGTSPDANSGIRIVAPISTTHYNWMIAAQQNINGGFEITPSTAVGGTTFSTPALSVLANGNVGIGTTSPGNKLTVNGDIAILAGNGIYFNNSVNTANSSIVCPGGGSMSLRSYGAEMIGLSENATLLFSTNSSERMRITSGGNVGIGTTNPGYKLDILASNSTDADIFRAGMSGVSNGFTVQRVSSSFRYSFLDGNVGIGTTNPQQLLHLKGSSTYTGLIIDNNSTTGGGYTSYRQNGSQSAIVGVSGTIEGNTSSDAGISADLIGGNIRFYTNGSPTEKMRITSGGNVGIGNSTVVSTNLVGATTIWKTYASDGASVPSPTAQNYYENQSSLYLFGRNSGLTIIGANGEGNAINFANSSTKVYASILGLNGTTATGGDMIFSVGSNTERMRITSGGNVLVGTTTDAGYKLQVNGSQNLGSTSLGQTILNIVSSTTGLSDIFFSDNVDNRGVIRYDHTSDFMSLWTAGGERMRITSGGNVGIGTTNPGRNLTVATSGESYISLTGGASSDVGYLFGTSASDAKGRLIYNNADNMQFWTVSTERMRITSGGDLLIATTTDAGAYPLQVNGSVYATAYYESSDLRLKNVLSERQGSDGINTITFKWKDGRDNLTHIGYAAQQVEKVLPDAVKTNTDGYKTINYDEVQSLKIANLEQEIAELKKIIKQLIDKK